MTVGAGPGEAEHETVLHQVEGGGGTPSTVRRSLRT